MDKNLLRQYPHLVKEYRDEEIRVEEMEKEIEEMKPDYKETTDIVSKGKRGKKPLGLCTVRGFTDGVYNRKRARIRERKAKQEIRLAQIENVILDVEEFINDVPDSETRRMMRFFYLEEKSWNEVAKAMGEGYSGEACKKKVNRELEKN